MNLKPGYPGLSFDSDRDPCDEQVDALGVLRQQGINVPASSSKDAASMSLEELVREKEQLEDVIAEREMAAGSESVAETS